MPVPYRIEPPAQHNRAGFSCGVAALDDYFCRQVTQDTRRSVAACYVAIDITTNAVAGFYTLSASGIALDHLPEALRKKLPRYPLVPVARLGRLAVDKKNQGQKLGAALLWDAAIRAARSEVAVFALVVDAKDDAAATFYRHHGFVPLDAASRHLIQPLENFQG
ncbi:MAG: GNAT family N-acetyltransferase [Rhizomicrobium sp.]